MVYTFIYSEKLFKLDFLSLQGKYNLSALCRAVFLTYRPMKSRQKVSTQAAPSLTQNKMTEKSDHFLILILHIYIA
ncbi:hypothetical protein C7R88_15630 [Plesiomonas shigelloides]|nr:hypothetical protein C7R88_15630 [Plesiomonas shigelloides]